MSKAFCKFSFNTIICTLGEKSKLSLKETKPNPVVKQVPITQPFEQISKTPKTRFARYPDKQGWFDKLKGKIGGLMQNRMVNGRNVENISATGPSFVSGAKSVKQYRGDENLP